MSTNPYGYTDDQMEAGRKAVEDALVELRDARIAVVGRNNGFCINERDGTPSDVIRLPIEVGFKIFAEAANSASISTVTIPKGVFLHLIKAASTLADECESSADFGDTQGRGHQSELDALEDCYNAIGVANTWAKENG